MLWDELGALPATVHPLSAISPREARRARSGVQPTSRPTGLGAGIDKDRPDYTVYCGGWAIGRIYATRGGPDHLRWFWSLTVNPPMARSDRVATLEEAKAQLAKSWDAWKAWAKLKETFC